MKINLKLSVLLLALFSVSRVCGQMSFDYLGDKWKEYLQRSVSDLTSLHHNHFKDTVSVKEMREAFFKNKDKHVLESPYAGFDSVVYIGGFGENAMLISPLKRHANKKIRECRGVWSWAGRYRLLQLLDKNGLPQKQLLEKLNGDKRQEWLDGEVLKLGEPRWYMGFVVSPRPNWDVYDKGRLVIRVGYSPNSEPDFFTFANLTKVVFDGDWFSSIDAGAKLLGMLQGMRSSVHVDDTERNFSVLLYAHPQTKYSQKVTYTLELLQPEHPDKETVELFQDFKGFVEHIPAPAFKPYYTTDFRILAGRYYRVTVSKCGWLVEDYFSTQQ